MATEKVDVLIVGAGLSGIGAACHLKRLCPDKRFAILEARSALGGTWDLFRYPGIRSDSDMYTLGYSFRPWKGAKAIADGPSILAYLQETAREEDVERHIRFGHRVLGAAWSSEQTMWTVKIARGDGTSFEMSCNFLLMCSGYYNYEEPYTPDFAGLDSFTGEVVHPQLWTNAVAVAGKRVVVIGSGATAVTLVPELAKLAAHVTLLQRSPTYMVSRPSVDGFAMGLRKLLGNRASYALTRWKNVLYGMFVFKMCRSRPQRVKNKLIALLRQQVGAAVDVAKHFTPRYNPWDQRLCLVPDGDFFKALKSGSVSITTDHIQRFTPTGLLLESGTELPADLVVTATGLQLRLTGGLALTVDGRNIESSQLVSYKGLMFAGVPNLASVFGYTNASWTLKADLSSAFVCRLLNHMQAKGVRQCRPILDDASMPLAPWVDFSSGYFQRVLDQLPKQGSKKPWKLNQNYITDLMTLRYGAVDDGVMRFSHGASHV